MRVMVDLCVVPLGVGVSVSEYVAACSRLIEAAGVEHQLHPYGTVIEGEWETVFALVKRCHERVHELGALRVFTTLKVGTRTDREQSMHDKVASVRRKLADYPDGDSRT
jgi:uncharacterized protein (TIGR00106 family)